MTGLKLVVQIKKEEEELKAKAEFKASTEYQKIITKCGFKPVLTERQNCELMCFALALMDLKFVPTESLKMYWKILGLTLPNCSFKIKHTVCKISLEVAQNLETEISYGHWAIFKQ